MHFRKTLTLLLAFICIQTVYGWSTGKNDTISKIQRGDSLNLSTITDTTFIATDSLTIQEANAKDDIGLTEDEYQSVADSLGVEVATIKAIVEIETGKCHDGIIEPGIPLVNFDAQVFSRFMRHSGKKYSKQKHSTAFRSPNVRKYKSFGLAQWARLESARKINRNIADKSTFWGMFQIGGFNWKKCGCSSQEEFVEKMSTSEFEQLKLFAEFCKNSDLVKYLKNKNWAAFSYRYNGPRYKAFRYDSRLRKAYNKFKRATP